MDLTAEEKQGGAFLGLCVVLTFCQPMKLPVVTGDKKWIHVNMEGPGLLPEVQEGRERSLGLIKDEQGMECSCGRDRDQSGEKGLQEVIRKEVEMEQKGDRV